MAYGRENQRFFVSTPNTLPTFVDGLDAFALGFTAFGLRASRFDFLFLGIFWFLIDWWRSCLLA